MFKWSPCTLMEQKIVTSHRYSGLYLDRRNFQNLGGLGLKYVQYILIKHQIQYNLQLTVHSVCTMFNMLFRDKALL